MRSANSLVSIGEIEIVDAFGEFLGLDRRDRAHVDHGLARREALGDAVRPEQNGLDVGRVWHHDDDHLGVLGGLLRAGAFGGAARHQRLGQIGAVLDDVEPVAAGLQMARHGPPHDAEADESDLGHAVCPSHTELRMR